MSKKKIALFTGSRADYSILNPLIKELNFEESISLIIIASGSHLSPDYGYTYKLIEKDGFKINEKINMLVNSDDSIGICKSIGLGLISYCESLERIKPEAIIILGDRYEAFAMAIAAHVLKIHLIHIHGGECTYGAIDDAFRHAITKMSTLHFTSTEEYAKRVIQLGEAPERVFNVGSLSIEKMHGIVLYSKKELLKIIGIDFCKDTMLITYHPVTLENVKAEKNIKNMLKSIDKFNYMQTIFTYANADTDGKKINKMIKEYCESNKHRAKCFETLGQKLYLSAMKNSKIVLGNSSSGIIEAPSLKIPTVNIGDRQKGRIQAFSIINCGTTEIEIKKSIEKALDKKFLKKVQRVRNPYYKKNTAHNIVKIIKNYNFKIGLKKEFFMLN